MQEVRRQQLCEHVRHRMACKECGGGSLALQVASGRQHSVCKECGGNSICEHGRQRSQCKECGGSGICEHRRQRSQCKECGGGSLCEHGRQRSRCKECGGSGLCEHGRQHNKCKDCSPRMCEHRRVRSTCTECAAGRDLASIYASALRKQARDHASAAAAAADAAAIARPCVRCYRECTWPSDREAAADGLTCLFCRGQPAHNGNCSYTELSSDDESADEGGGEGQDGGVSDAEGEAVIVLSAVHVLRPAPAVPASWPSLWRPLPALLPASWPVLWRSSARARA